MTFYFDNVITKYQWNMSSVAKHKWEGQYLFISYKWIYYCHWYIWPLALYTLPLKMPHCPLTLCFLYGQWTTSLPSSMVWGKVTSCPALIQFLAQYAFTLLTDHALYMCIHRVRFWSGVTEKDQIILRGDNHIDRYFTIRKGYNGWLL